MSSSLIVPTVIETTGRGERAYDLFSRLLKERIIMINSQVEETMAGLVVAQLLFLASESTESEIIHQHTGQPLERIKRDTERDYFMSATEAVEYGIIDEVLTLAEK